MRKINQFQILSTIILALILGTVFLPYVTCTLFEPYLGFDYMTGLSLITTMAGLQSNPDSVSIFGYESYETVMMILLILAILMTAIPVLLGLFSWIMEVCLKKRRFIRASFRICCFNILLYIGYGIGFMVIGNKIGMDTKPGYGLAIALILWLIQAALYRSQYPYLQKIKKR